MFDDSETLHTFAKETTAPGPTQPKTASRERTKTTYMTLNEFAKTYKADCHTDLGALMWHPTME